MRTCFRLCGRRVSSPLVLAAVAALAAAEALAAALAAATEVPGATRAARHVGRLRLALTVVVHRVELHLVALSLYLSVRPRAAGAGPGGLLRPVPARCYYSTAISLPASPAPFPGRVARRDATRRDAAGRGGPGDGRPPCVCARALRSIYRECIF